MAKMVKINMAMQKMAMTILKESPRAKTLVPQLTEPIPNGERFPDIGYVHTLMKDCPKRHKTNVQIFEAIAAMGKGLQPDDFITEYYDQRVLAVLKAVLTNLEGKPLKGMLQYRAMVCHTLLYHRFNDLPLARIL
uniref:Uncharacterized protein n=1 Tax=Oryza punctata TaxID=4537 RepID=A0A0E0KMV2_ORYPU